MALKIISLNTWNYHEWSNRKTKFINFFKQENPDIILFQEINDDTRYNNPINQNLANEINNELKYPICKTFFHTIFDGTTKKDLGTHSYMQGIAILSKKKISIIKHHILHKEKEDKYKRGIVIFKIDQEKEIHMVNLHFSNNREFASKHWEETKKVIANLKIRPVFVGDFNIFKEDFVNTKLPVNYSATYLEKPYISYPCENQTLDYVVYPKEITIKEFLCPEINISDHRPLIFEIE